MEPFEILTDGGDDGSGEEEGAALVPVAGIVGRVFEGTHARAHGIDGVLQKSEEGVKVRKNNNNTNHDGHGSSRLSSTEGFKVTIACQLG